MQRFWGKIEKLGEEECWNWTAGKNRGGYGWFAFRGRSWISSRVVWTITFGEIPEDAMVCHRCDNRSCCNPKHLYLGNAVSNSKDMVDRGRHPGTKKTHCPKGHPYDGDNLWISNIGGRTCLTCAKARSRYARKNTPGVYQRALEYNREYHKTHSVQISERKARNFLLRKKT